jgi:hypothetical protein
MTELDKAAYRRAIDQERARIGNDAFKKSEPPWHEATFFTWR